MSLTHLKNLRDALVTVIKRIKTANGYSTNTVDANIFSVYNAKKLQARGDADYPKVFVITDDGDRTRKNGGKKDRATNFIVVFIGKITTTGATPEQTADMVDNFVDDLEKALDSDDTLGQAVYNAEMTHFTVDSGFTFPEGVAVCRVGVMEDAVVG